MQSLIKFIEVSIGGLRYERFQLTRLRLRDDI